MNHHLLRRHREISRTVADIPGGVVTKTTAGDPELAEMIRGHVRRMKRRMGEHRPIRTMDPFFVELFRRADEIDMEVEEIEGGVRVRERSNDPEVVRLIRAHARRAVSEFVARGFARIPEKTPLPEGYPFPDG